MAPSVAIAEVEESIAKSLSIDGEELNESATGTPSVGGSGGKESLNVKASPARGGFRGGAVAGIIWGDASGKDDACARRFGGGGGEDAAERSERSVLRVRSALRLVSSSMTPL